MNGLKIFKDTVKLVDNCNRIEVIDETGRAYVNWKPDNIIEMSMQDDGRTMKIFVSTKKRK